MRYRTDKKSGNELSVLGFGCMRLPLDSGRAEKLILTAIERGVNYFDTALVYPNSETTLGNILHKNGVRDKIYLATKLPFQKCKTYEDFEKVFQTQLERLKTDYINYYLIHNLSEQKIWERLAELGIEKWISEKKQSGQIREIGFSFHGARNGFLSLIDAYDWDFCLIQYNYMDENYQAGRAGLRRAHEKGMPVIVMEPMLGGKLANGLPPKAASCFKNYDPKRTAASWALRWLYNQPEVTVVLSGMNAAEQLEDNLSTADEASPGMLSENESAVYKPVVEAFRESYKIPCTGCNYCMPCPRKVNIPGCFSAYNASFSFGYIAGLSMYLTGTGINHPEKNYGAGNCAKCGACEKKCPQHINIPNFLEEVTRRMEPIWVRAVMKAAGLFMR